MSVLLSDRCTADADVKPSDVTIEGEIVAITEDRIVLTHDQLIRIEPVGFGDVHWELNGIPSLRYTHIEKRL